MPYLTKSRFKLALECTTKLYYNDNKQYANKAFEDNFLKELATGGFQVGALAQCYFPTGVSINTLDHQDAYSQTLSLLQQEYVTIFEAAFLYENCFIRADLVVKKGNTIQLIEVKAKSYAASKNSFYKKKQEGLNSNWEPYLYDIAFQTWVTRHCIESNGMTDGEVAPYLMLANKEANTSVDGLNQRFFYNPAERKIELNKALTTPKELGNEILIKVDVSKEVQYIFEQPVNNSSFSEFIKQSADAVKKGEIIRGDIGVKCKKCNFIASEEAIASGELNGFHECWKEKAKFSDEDFKKSMAWEIWGSNKAAKWIEAKKYFIEQLNISDLEPKSISKTISRGISRLERQDIQRLKTIKQDYSIHINKAALQEYFSEWQYPFHCIDFETTAVALPFYKGMHPYEQVAFQFSHHILHEDGSVVHQTEWLNATPGLFPNFDFARALKKALEIEGTIFRFAAHENTILIHIHKQLSNSEEPDKDELMKFIEGITTKKNEKEIVWDGARTMVDLRDVVVQCYYSLHAKGSNSIKYILPAVLNSSAFIQAKYSEPIYGTTSLPSKNFKDYVWIKKVNGQVENPYRLLEPVFSKEEDEMLDDLLMDEECGIYDGGAAMAAYGKMQFTRMTNAERERISKALLRYCELDTLAMVVILEEFRELLK